MNYVYKLSEPRVWTVGCYDAEGAWISESDHDSAELAAERCRALNGGGQVEAFVVDGIKVTPAYVRRLRGVNASMDVRLQAADEALEVATRMAQELREFSDEAEESGGAPLPTVLELVEEWETAYQRARTA